jgi:hypothetical protein
MNLVLYFRKSYSSNSFFVWWDGGLACLSGSPYRGGAPTWQIFSRGGVRSHSHDSSFMHSDVSLFYSYTVVAETHFVIVTAPLVSLFMT